MSNELAIQEKRFLLAQQQGNVLVHSGMLPQTVKTWQAAAAIIMMGQELGLSPMQSFSHIHVIKGKPTISAELMRALVFSRAPGCTFDYVQLTDNVCEIRAGRANRTASTFTFTLVDAQKAQLLGNENWKKYPKAMLNARCTAIVCRALFADVLCGFSYTPEELAPETLLDEEGFIEASFVPQLTKGASNGATPTSQPESTRVVPESTEAPPTASEGLADGSPKEELFYASIPECVERLHAVLLKLQVPSGLHMGIVQMMEGVPMNVANVTAAAVYVQKLGVA